MNEIEVNTTCDIYKREIGNLIASGDPIALSKMVETWYARCGFGQCFDGTELLDAGVTDQGIVWLKTNKGILQFSMENQRWRLLHEERNATHALVSIAEVMQVPFAYLCGVRDAVAVIEKNDHKYLSNRVSELSAIDKTLSKELRRKRIAIDLVLVDVPADPSQSEIKASRYPDAPAATLTWGQVRQHYRSTPGVYFAWSNGRIVYVGATERGMHSRFGSGHHAVTSKDSFSFIELPVNEVYFAECCYVAKYSPERNACVAQALGVRQGGHRGKRRYSDEASAAS